MSANAGYTEEKISKIGNVVRYFTKDSGQSKTKILKLVYLVEEMSIKKFGIPFFNISFQVWKFGPVAEPIFVETSSSPSMFTNYFEIHHTEDGSVISGIGDFDDFEFSDNDISILEEIKAKYNGMTAKELVKITHRKNSPWYNEAKRRGVLEDLLNERITNTHYTVDLTELLKGANPLKLEMYYDFIDIDGNPNTELLRSLEPC